MPSITTADVVDDGTGDRADLIRQIAKQAQQIVALEARVGELMDVVDSFDHVDDARPVAEVEAENDKLRRELKAARYMLARGQVPPPARYATGEVPMPDDVVALVYDGAGHRVLGITAAGQPILSGDSKPRDPGTLVLVRRGS